MNTQRWMLGSVAVLGLVASSSSAAENYYAGAEIAEWQPGGVAGAGTSIAVADQWSVRIGYRRTWYKELRYNTFLADGTQVETNSSKLVQSMWNLGLIREF